MTLRLDGVLVATLTPFRENYDLDEEGLRSLIRHLAKAGGLSGYVCNAGAGEGGTLTREERIRCIEIIREEVEERAPVVAGIDALSTREAIQQTRDAKEAGAAAVMLTPPHIFDWSATANPEFALQYFHNVAAAVEMPITIFNYHPSNPYGYPPEVSVQIAREIDAVVAIKVSGGGDVRRYEKVLRGMRALPRHVSVLATSSLFQHFITGGDGALTGFANFAPGFCVDLFRAVKSGDLESSRQLHEINYALEAAVYRPPNVYKHSRYKVAAYLAGLVDNMIVRPPQVAVPDDEVRLLREALAKLGWLRR